MATEPIRFSSRTKVIIVVVLLAVGALLLYRIWDIFVPFFWAMLTAYIAHPLIKWLHAKTRVPRVIWIILLYIVAGNLIYWAVAVLVPVVSRQYEELRGDIPSALRSLQTFVQENPRLEILGLQVEVRSIADQVVQAIGRLAQDLPRQVVAGVTVVLETVVKLVIYLIATFYFLLFGEKWVAGGIALLPARAQGEFVPLLQRIHLAVTAFLRAQLVRIVMMSTLYSVGLSVLQVRFALILGVVGGFLDIVPQFGPIVAAIIAVAVVLLQQAAPFGWSPVVQAIAVVLLFIVLNQLEEQIVLPLLIGYMVDLPPLVVLFSVLAGGSLAGVPGLFLGVPVAATVRILLRYLYAKLMDQTAEYEEVRRPRRLPLWRRWRKRLGKEGPP